MYLLPDLAADWRTADGADQSPVCDTLLKLLSLSARTARSQFGRQLLLRVLIVDRWNICRGLNRRITAAPGVKFPPCVAASGTALLAAGSTSPPRPRRINTYRTVFVGVDFCDNSREVNTDFAGCYTFALLQLAN